MITMTDIPAGGLALFLLLGLRHGIEPDHIAAMSLCAASSILERPS